MRLLFRRYALISSAILLALGVGLAAVNLTFASSDEVSVGVAGNYNDYSEVEKKAAIFTLTLNSADKDKGKIGLAYSDAVTAINTAEKRSGITSETNNARIDMQLAIDSFMDSNGYDETDQLTQNLHTYSKYLTETLIERST